MAERTVTIGSAGKSLSMTGWKVGWATGPTDLVAAVRVAAPAPVVRLRRAVPVGGGRGPRAARRLLARRSATGSSASATCSATGLAALGFPVTVPQGTYFATTDVRPLGYADGWAFCRDLPHRAGVVAIPHEVFHDDPEAGTPFVRWAFCKRPEVLAEALDRLGRAFG